MGDRCSGHCCRRFFLPKSPADLEAMLASYRRNGGDPDVPLVATMGRVVEVIEAKDVPAYAERLGVGVERVQVASDGCVYSYRCVHLQENGDCGIYAMRPRLCREYPYGRKCEQPECTWAAATGDDPPGDGSPVWPKRPGAARVVGSRWTGTAIYERIVEGPAGGMEEGPL